MNSKIVNLDPSDVLPDIRLDLSSIQELWFHGPISQVIAETRLLKDGSFLVISSPPGLIPPTYWVCIKWNGIVSKIPIHSKFSESSSYLIYDLGGAYQFPSISQLIQFYQDNQIPISGHSEAVLFTPVQAPICESPSSKQVGRGAGSARLLQVPSALKPRNLSRSLVSLINSQKPPIYLNRSNIRSRGIDSLENRDNNYFKNEHTNLKVNRQQIRYLQMDEKPVFIRSLGNLAQASNSNTDDYCDIPSLLCADKGSTFSLPGVCNNNSTTTPILSSLFSDGYAVIPAKNRHSDEETHKRVPQKPPVQSLLQLDAICHGFIDYDLTLAEIPVATGCDEVFDPKVWCTIGVFLLSNDVGAHELARHLSMETVNLLLLKWAESLCPIGSISSGPSNGFSLILWPAANGFREDLINRDRFLTLFVIASLALQQDSQLRSSILSLWLQTLDILINTLRDFFTANSVLRAILSPEITSLRETLKATMSHLDNINLQEWAELVPSSQSLPISAETVEIHSACFSTMTTCVPNLIPLVTLFVYMVTGRQLTPCPLSGSLANHLNSSVEQAKVPFTATLNGPLLDTARQRFRISDVHRRRSSSYSAINNRLWVEKLFLSSKFENPIQKLKQLLRSEIVLRLIIGRMAITRGAQINAFYFLREKELNCLCKKLI